MNFVPSSSSSQKSPQESSLPNQKSIQNFPKSDPVLETKIGILFQSFSLSSDFFGKWVFSTLIDHFSSLNPLFDPRLATECIFHLDLTPSPNNISYLFVSLFAFESRYAAYLKGKTDYSSFSTLLSSIEWDSIAHFFSDIDVKFELIPFLDSKAFQSRWDSKHSQMYYIDMKNKTSSWKAPQLQFRFLNSSEIQQDPQNIPYKTLKDFLITLNNGKKHLINLLVNKAISAQGILDPKAQNKIQKMITSLIHDIGQCMGLYQDFQSKVLVGEYLSHILHTTETRWENLRRTDTTFCKLTHLKPISGQVANSYESFTTPLPQEIKKYGSNAWKTIWDPEWKRFFYFNMVTQDSTWERPSNM